MKKIFIMPLVFIFLTSSILPLYGYSQAPAYLCEIGLKFYQQGRNEEALHEFKKALLLQPNYEPALRYIRMIEQPKVTQIQEGVIPPVKRITVPSKPTAAPTRAGAIRELLDIIELEQRMMEEGQLVPELTPQGVPRVLILDGSLKEIPQPIEIEQGRSIIVKGKNIQRFLVTQPNILAVERKSPDELLLTGNEIGYTYLHVWDDNGRWTQEFLGVYPVPEGLVSEEALRREAERARNFKLRYTLDWFSYETGRRLNKLNRSTYSWSHGLTLKGQTPYGNLDSAATVRRLKTSSDLTFFTLGLTEGKFGPFEGFTLRGFDYSPPFNNLTFHGANLRGVMLNSPAFNKKLDYISFWGREGGGRFGGLSPGLTKTRHSFLEGFNAAFIPTTKQNYAFSLLHGWGRDRESFLNSYDYDLSGNWKFDKWRAGYEIAYDSETFAHLFNARYAQPKLELTTEIRDINKNFFSITGRGWRAGEVGNLLNLNYTPTEKLRIRSSLDVYRDRFFPASDNDNRLNEDFNSEVSYQLDPSAALGLNYTLNNDLGKLSQSRYQAAGVTAAKRFKFLRDIYTFANYSHRESKNFSSPSSDYINERLYAGLRFNLIDDLYYFVNKEMNWLTERFFATHTTPNVLETGLDWSRQIGNSPYYGNFRFVYHDEEDTVSNLNFLSGEDYIEGYSELTYRSGDKEMYVNSRLRSVWAENPTVNKRIEATFNAGLRYLWDTGIRWEAVGNIEGYVFKDFNSDALRQRDEPPVEGVKIWLGKDKSTLTDIFGYYKFKGIKAYRAYVTIDTSTLPSGFILTVPVTQEVTIAHHRGTRVDFGIVSRSEISGLVFEDADGNGQYSKDEKAISGATVTLENGKKAITDGAGRYSFANVTSGKHTISLDINTLPIYYLPKVSLTKEITLFEGITYIHNIPLKRIKEE